MSLRLRLIVVFFLLSVVPVGAVTLYGYTSNAQAIRDAARREAELLAGELSQRMQVVTAQLSERVEHLMDLADAAAAVDTAVESGQAQTSAAVSSTVASSATSASETLGSIAMLLTTSSCATDFEAGAAAAAAVDPACPMAAEHAVASAVIPREVACPPQPPAPPTRSSRANGCRHRRRRHGRGPRRCAPTTNDRRSRRRRPTARARRWDPHWIAPAYRARWHRPRIAGPTAGLPPGAPAPPGTWSSSDRISIDLMPIRRDIMEQYASQEEFAKLSAAEQERIRGEVSQRMLGIQMGIRWGPPKPSGGLRTRCGRLKRRPKRPWQRPCRSPL